MYVGGTPEYILFRRQKKEITMQFTERFKESIVQKLLIPGGQKASELSKKLGCIYSLIILKYQKILAIYGCFYYLELKIN